MSRYSRAAEASYETTAAEAAAAATRALGRALAETVTPPKPIVQFYAVADVEDEQDGGRVVIVDLVPEGPDADDGEWVSLHSWQSDKQHPAWVRDLDGKRVRVTIEPA